MEDLFFGGHDALSHRESPTAMAASNMHDKPVHPKAQVQNSMDFRAAREGRSPRKILGKPIFTYFLGFLGYF